MKTIIVDDEPEMLNNFRKLSQGIESLNMVGEFQYPVDALDYALTHPVDLALLDIAMPCMTGLNLAERLRENNPQVLIAFLTASEKHIREANLLDADDYILKPYTRETLENMARRMSFLSRRLQKSLYVQTFGNFLVLKDDKPVPLTGKAKEILALVVTRRGKEISNEEIFSTVWESRAYSNENMTVYYNALRRLKNTLENEGLGELLHSTTRGQMLNTEITDCDYFAWLDRNPKRDGRFEGEFLSEYSWAESLLAELLHQEGLI